MNIAEFVGNYKNHPVLFVGTGISLRYSKTSYTWDGLLKRISYEISNNQESYLDIKSSCEENGKYKYEKIASILEEKFNQYLLKNRAGKFEEINNIFYAEMEKNINISRFKIFIAKLLGKTEIKSDMEDEIAQLKKARKNISSIITTNYDALIETIFEFNPLIGNDILLSNPYGSVYKIHGCCSDPSKIIITADDYEKFKERYELIRAQLLSIFIHNPIIFLGYNVGDNNIKSILKTIFTYIEPNSEVADKIRQNFLLVEYESNSDNQEITEHDIDLEGFATVRINKIKTNNYSSIYNSLSNLALPISAMDVRKVQTIVKEIYSGGDIKVNFTEDMDTLSNSDKIIVIGSKKTIQYSFQSKNELMLNYFNIIDESNSQILVLINKHTIQNNEYFPIYGFGKIYGGIEKIDLLKKQQLDKLNSILATMSHKCRTNNPTVNDISNDTTIPASSRVNAILYGIMNDRIDLNEIEQYLRSISKIEQTRTDYRKLLCAYDFKKYAHENER